MARASVAVAATQTAKVAVTATTTAKIAVTAAQALHIAIQCFNTHRIAIAAPADVLVPSKAENLGRLQLKDLQRVQRAAWLAVWPSEIWTSSICHGAFSVAKGNANFSLP